MPKILDNIDNKTEGELLDTLGSSYRLDAAIGYFNLRGWKLLADAVGAMTSASGGGPKARVLVGIHEPPADEMRRLVRMRKPEPVDNKTASRLKGKVVSEYRDQLQVGLPTEGDEVALRTLLRQIEAGEVEVRVHTSHRLHAKLYLCHREDTAAPRVGYVGSSNLTVAGLREQGELNVDVVDGDATDKLAAWFEDRWNDPLTVNAMPELAESIRESWASEDRLDPYFVYLKMAYHLSREAREGLIEYGLPASMRERLLDFQAAAVKIAARIVMQKGGAIIGDVVGLGKTLVGTAVARLLQEDQGFETLVICPKNLTEMWKSYMHDYEIRGKVESLSMVHKFLPDARRYRLVIIDEAHNLRSETRRDHGVIKSYIEENESRVLLLTATPYNKGLGDLASQLSLFIRPDEDLGVRPERAIAEVGQAKLENLCGGSVSTLTAFRKSDHIEDWQALMSQYLVRRTRKFVEDNYAKEDEQNRRYLEFGAGRKFYFPERNAAPMSLALSEGDSAHAMSSDETIESICNLLLPRYGLGDYIDEGFEPADDSENTLVDDLRNSSRGNLVGFTRVTMLKRLSSSGPAFIATLRRHLLRNMVTMHALEKSLPIPVGSVDNSLWRTESDVDPEDDDEEGGDGVVASAHTEGATAEAYSKLKAQNPKAVRWAPRHMFDDQLLKDLSRDTDVLSAMLDRFGTWDASRDGKIASLEKLLTEKHPKEKVLVFTEAADTANYIQKELVERGVEAISVVTGDSDNPTSLARRFSPGSNNVAADNPILKNEIRVLVSTDVLSEGQNLQDSHIIVNYDLPWAIVKLVQRAGRVDRIGQKSPEVVVYSLLPAASIEEEIELRGRILRRLGENAELLGSDEEFFGEDDERKIISGVYDEHSIRGAIDEVDPVSMAYEIWRRAEANYPDIAKRVESLPNIVYSTKQIATENKKEGVLVHTQTIAKVDTFAFVSLDGEAARITPQDALRLAECDPSDSAIDRLKGHHDLTETALGGPLRATHGRATSYLQGVRGKVWRILHDGMGSFKDNLLFTRDEVGAAHDAMNERSLYDSATNQLAKAARSYNPNDLAALVVGLHREDKLCIPPISEESSVEPDIVCTMGFRKL